MWLVNNFGDDDVPSEHVEGRQVVVTLRLVLNVVDNLGHGLQVGRAQLFSVCVRNLNIKITKPSLVWLDHFKSPRMCDGLIGLTPAFLPQEGLLYGMSN